MLSIGKISAGPQAARYYTDQIAQGREDYYAGEGEAPGRWVGSAAAAAGLEGQVEAGAFADLLQGGGLRTPVRGGAIAGFDLTFRAPKSVSVLWGVADPAVTQQLGEAHDAAVDAALGYLEREACHARRGKGGATQVRGAGFVAAAFRHRASRAGDPLLHTHLVAGNLTLGPDERWTALDARHLYRHAKTAGYLYQSQLRMELTQRLGLSWEQVERGTADVMGVPRGVVEHFSQRRAQILEHMSKHGGRSAQSAQVAALETRRAKQDLNADLLREQWRARAAEHGLSAATLTRILRPGDRAIPFAAAVDHRALTEQVSVFGRAELLQALAAAQPQGAPVEELERMADRMIAADPELVALPAGPVPAGLTECRFSTTELLAVEQDLLDQADRGRRDDVGIAWHEAVGKAAKARGLSDEQHRVVDQLCRNGDSVAVVRAAAGTGKTFVLDAAREAWQDAGHEVLGCALSARAALELSDQAAIPSVTIAQLEHRLDDGLVLAEGSVLVVDEAGMVGTRDLARLAQATEQARGKLVLVGDDRQLPEIQAGGAFRALAERLPVAELHEVRRQREDWDRQALDALRSGEIERWARAYREHGRITVADTAPDARAALLNDWARASGDTLMIAGRRDDVADLNARARQLLQAEGRLGPDELEVAGRGYAVGDRVIGARNDRQAGILNGQRGTLTACEPDARTVDLCLDNGSSIRLQAEYLEKGSLEHGYAITAHRAQGATVDQTFVLGSEELYREWGYTALSRHRDQARFYLAQSDLRDDRDLPPARDPLIDGISRLMKRSNAKQLAVESLTHEQREHLELERRELREEFRGSRPPERDTALEHRDLETVTGRLQGARQREQLLLEQREHLRLRDRKARANIDAQLERNRAEQRMWSSQTEDVLDARSRADGTDAAWLATHAEPAARLLTVTQELRARDAADHVVTQRLDGLRRDPLERMTSRQHLEADLDLDLGL